MSRKAWIIVGVIVLALFFFGGPVVVRVIKNASVVGDRVPEDARGLVTVAPSTILRSVNAELRAAGKPTIDLHQLAVARALRSEHGSEPAAVRRWVAWAIRNGARRSRMSLFNKLTKSRNPKTSGKFARQRTDSRFAATNRGANLQDITIAREVLAAPAGDDPTKGATNFFSPRAQDALFRRAQAGDPKVKGRITRDAAAQRKKWIAGGLLSRGAPPGATVRDVEFFGRVA